MSVPAAIANEALKIARTHLNDEHGSLWPDWKIMPKLRAAYREMMNEFERNNIPVVNNVSTIMTVVANTVDDNSIDMSTPANITAGTFPTDMLEPIWMKERAIGQMNADFVDMTKVDFIPNIPLGNELVWWSWIGSTIMLRGAFVPTQVQLRYKRVLTPPNAAGDSLTVPLAETYLGAETAYLCLASLPNSSQTQMEAIKALGERNLDNLLADAIQGLQTLPAKRRPYHRGRGRSRAVRDF